jgi:acyl dehydratase
LPAHLFPQWGFAPALRALSGLPYPYGRAVNAGCRIDVRGPLPAGEPLQVRARVEAVDDDGRRVLVTLRVVTGTRGAPEALEADLRVHLPAAAREKGGKQRRVVPDGAVEVARLAIDRRAGLDFALLTGDFNPIHWVPAYARAVGFPSTILHGFGTLAWTVESLAGAGGPLEGDPSRLVSIDVRFTRPLVLPARVSVYTGPGPGSARGVWVGEHEGADANLEGSFSAA